MLGTTLKSFQSVSQSWIYENIRQFVRFGFKPVEAAKADLFCVSIRLPACLLERILNRSGSAGAYVEPRSADGQRVLQEYMVIWTGKMPLQDLAHLKQTNPAVVGLARVSDRRGAESLC